MTAVIDDGDRHTQVLPFRFRGGGLRNGPRGLRCELRFRSERHASHRSSP
jgi:hypothetical protein